MAIEDSLESLEDIIEEEPIDEEEVPPPIEEHTEVIAKDILKEEIKNIPIIKPFSLEEESKLCIQSYESENNQVGYTIKNVSQSSQKPLISFIKKEGEEDITEVTYFFDKYKVIEYHPKSRDINLLIERIKNHVALQA